VTLAHFRTGCYDLLVDAGWSSPVARWAHNPKVAGSNPAPATKNCSSRGQNGDNPVTTRGRSASRRQAKRSAFVFPAHLQPSPEFLVRHVEVSLRLLDARVSEHQLNDSNVDTVREQSTSALVTQIVPAEIDSVELLAISLRSLSGWLRLDVVRE
jgi:hypothetical protein